MTQATADIGVVGMAVMGRNLALNMADRGHTVAIYNRGKEPLREVMAGLTAGQKVVCPTDLTGGGDDSSDADLKSFLLSLKRPRRAMLMIKAGKPVDMVIDQMLATGALEAGDIIIDGGNSHFDDTARRVDALAKKGLHFVGCGISGGEEGARHGPSIMPGGAREAWPHVREIFQSIAAKVDGGTPCCAWIGEGGAGHFVKMVHNGIEYGDMQIICEAYHLMSAALGMDAAAIQKVFAEWNRGELDSYLIEITADILARRDDKGAPMIDVILDAAGQKGTGKWTVVAAADHGLPLTLITEAVFARSLSALKDERVAAAKVLPGPKAGAEAAGDRRAMVAALEQALLASKIVSYAQGYQLMRAASADRKWNLAFGDIALVWRGGCIIRSAFLGRIKEAFDRAPDLVNLMIDPYFAERLARAQDGWRRVVAAAVAQGIPVPALSSALSYYDGYRAARLPANLLQAQRDYFGAHTYERLDRPRGEFFHTDWIGAAKA